MKKMFAKNKDFFLVVLSVLVICLSLTIIYDKFIKGSSITKEIIINNTL